MKFTVRLYIYIYISSWIFENVPQKGLEYSHRNLASPVSGDCGENFHRGLAVLVGLIVKLSPWATLPWAREGPPCQSLRGKGAAKAWYGPLVSLDNQLTDHVSALSLSFQTSFNVSGRLANERVPLTHALGWEAVSGQYVGEGGDVALNSPLRACLSLKLPPRYV